MSHGWRLGFAGYGFAEDETTAALEQVSLGLEAPVGNSASCSSLWFAEEKDASAYWPDGGGGWDESSAQAACVEKPGSQASSEIDDEAEEAAMRALEARWSKARASTVSSSPIRTSTTFLVAPPTVDEAEEPRAAPAPYGKQPAVPLSPVATASWSTAATTPCSNPTGSAHQQSSSTVRSTTQFSSGQVVASSPLPRAPQEDTPTRSAARAAGSPNFRVAGERLRQRALERSVSPTASRAAAAGFPIGLGSPARRLEQSSHMEWSTSDLPRPSHASDDVGDRDQGSVPHTDSQMADSVAKRGMYRASSYGRVHADKPQRVCVRLNREQRVISTMERVPRVELERRWHAAEVRAEQSDRLVKKLEAQVNDLQQAADGSSRLIKILADAAPSALAATLRRVGTLEDAVDVLCDHLRKTSEMGSSQQASRRLLESLAPSLGLVEQSLSGSASSSAPISRPVTPLAADRPVQYVRVVAGASQASSVAFPRGVRAGAPVTVQQAGESVGARGRVQAVQGRLVQWSGRWGVTEVDLADYVSVFTAGSAEHEVQTEPEQAPAPQAITPEMVPEFTKMVEELRATVDSSTRRGLALSKALREENARRDSEVAVVRAEVAKMQHALQKIRSQPSRPADTRARTDVKQFEDSLRRLSGLCEEDTQSLSAGFGRAAPMSLGTMHGGSGPRS
mmetsp:Transcript_32928/g.71875  ORF Transcript_32928/g.71875 Transcript_32928/m.71875 type:complete len:680 (+) Transcript_32928:36-2075(+)|eukprot:CAMPEP_0204314974 /NCGR_PEP_ID=MMETSP0469-20131031/4551_1 /ASSEMBLY_ACC=CAM_ASM_000384 /TAXON_ID=2969 /ORGANISM="Oxyrrhis marina" /LENGTH=679 /DNA_ID=CAMNT_0051295557 /DNA_START=24 /DNA_END=2063 /DNA_ORIENTATION=+